MSILIRRVNWFSSGFRINGHSISNINFRELGPDLSTITLTLSVAQNWSLDRLEWPAVRVALSAFCQSPLAAERMRSLTPNLSRQDVERIYTLIRAATEVDRLGAWPGLANLVDITPVTARAERGAVLEGTELRDVANLASAARSYHRVLGHYSNGRPALAGWLARIQPVDELLDVLEDSLDADGSLKDSASPELARLREEVRHRSQGLRTRLMEVLRSSRFQPFLQDEFFTLRENRFVVPLKAGAQAQIDGIVHDTSNTGATVFIEPVEVIDANNRLKTAMADLAREELRIRRELSTQVAARSFRLSTNLELLTEIDLILARVRYAVRAEATVPDLAPPDSRGFHLKALAHPLLRLQQVPCVTNDLKIDARCRMVIVSGPNTGGKTVLLKSLGLASLCVRAGVPVSAAEGTQIPFVPAVYADIGDTQDLSGALSSFSGHLFQIRRILEEAQPGSVAVMDELISGTDPAEGSALGRALLDSLDARGVLAVISTHYDDLKLLPSENGRRLVAGMEFDPVTLKPTYRIRVGVPGHSRAIEVAGRLGFPAEIIERAQGFLSESGREVTRLIEELEDRNQTLELERNALIGERKDLEKTERELRAEIAKLKTAEGKKLGTDVAQLREEVNELRSLVKMIRKQAETKAGARDLVKRADSAIQRAIHLSGKAQSVEIARDASPALTKEAARPGTPVRLRGSDTIGRIDSVPDGKGRVWVEFSGQRTQTTLDRLIPVKTAKAKERRQWIPLGAKMESRLDDIELDLHGMREEEALKEVEKFLDTAMAQNMDKVRIIHGLGSGRLQKAVREYLKCSPYVARFETAVPQAGGHGVTEVLLKG